MEAIRYQTYERRRPGMRARSQLWIRLSRRSEQKNRHIMSDLGGCERSIKIKLKIKKTYFENKSNTILKIKDLAAKIK